MGFLSGIGDAFKSLGSSFLMKAAIGIGVTYLSMGTLGPAALSSILTTSAVTTGTEKAAQVLTKKLKMPPEIAGVVTQLASAAAGGAAGTGAAGGAATSANTAANATTATQAASTATQSTGTATA